MKQIVTISILVNQFYLFLWCQLIHITQFQIYILFLVATCHFISFHLWALNGWCSDASLHRFNLFCFTAKTCYSNRPLIFHDLVDLFYVVVFLSLNSPISNGFEFHSEMVTFISRCEMVLIVWKCIFISGSRKSGKKNLFECAKLIWPFQSKIQISVHKLSQFMRSIQKCINWIRKCIRYDGSFSSAWSVLSSHIWMLWIFFHKFIFIMN